MNTKERMEKAREFLSNMSPEESKAYFATENCLVKRITKKEVTKGENKWFNDLRLRFLNYLKDSDELWEFDRPKEAWYALCGAKGYAILRDGKVIKELRTVVN